MTSHALCGKRRKHTQQRGKHITIPRRHSPILLRTPQGAPLNADSHRLGCRLARVGGKRRPSGTVVPAAPLARRVGPRTLATDARQPRRLLREDTASRRCGDDGVWWAHRTKRWACHGHVWSLLRGADVGRCHPASLLCWSSGGGPAAAALSLPPESPLPDDDVFASNARVWGDGGQGERLAARDQDDAAFESCVRPTSMPSSDPVTVAGCGIRYRGWRKNMSIRR